MLKELLGTTYPNEMSYALSLKDISLSRPMWYALQYAFEENPTSPIPFEQFEQWLADIKNDVEYIKGRADIDFITGVFKFTVYTNGASHEFSFQLNLFGEQLIVLLSVIVSPHIFEEDVNLNEVFASEYQECSQNGIVQQVVGRTGSTKSRPMPKPECLKALKRAVK